MWWRIGVIGIVFAPLALSMSLAGSGQGVLGVPLSQIEQVALAGGTCGAGICNSYDTAKYCYSDGSDIRCTSQKECPSSPGTEACFDLFEEKWCGGEAPGHTCDDLYKRHYCGPWGKVDGTGCDGGMCPRDTIKDYCPGVTEQKDAWSKWECRDW